MLNQELNLSRNELRLIVEHRNISDYEKKSAKDLIKALTRSRPRLGIFIIFIIFKIFII